MADDKNSSVTKIAPRAVAAKALTLSKRRPFGLGLGIGTIVTLAVVVLIIQNGESAQIDWLFLHFTSPLWIILFITMASGAVVWELIKMLVRRGRKRSALHSETTKQARAL